MPKVFLPLGTAALLCAAAVPAIAQDSTAPTQTTAAAEASTPQPTEKEAKALDRCKRLTAAQRAQSSKCTDLMEKFGISEKDGNDLMRRQALGH